MSRFLLVTTLFSAISVLSAMADGVSGRVADGGGQPLAFANIALLGSGDSAFVGGAVSDSAGFFRISGVAGGTYALRVSLVGYATQTCSVAAPDSAVSITLLPAGIALREATVRASRPVFTTERGAIVADVAGSSLQYETQTIDVLRKIPGLTFNQDKLQTFDGLKPVVYIDGRKAMSDKEVEQLPVRDIKTVKLLLNPGAEYDASAGAVLLITTRRRASGLSLAFDEYLCQTRRLTDDQTLSMSYTTGRLSLFGTVEQSDVRSKLRGNWDIVNSSGADTYRDVLYAPYKYTSHEWDFNIGATYRVADGHELGFGYRAEMSASHMPMRSRGLNSLGGVPTDSIATTENRFTHDYLSHYNAYYKGDMAKKLHFEFFGDYVNSRERETQKVVEASTAAAGRTVGQVARTRNEVWALKSLLRWDIGDKSSLLLGGEWGRTDNSISRTYNDVLPNSDYRNLERRAAAFAQASCDLGRWSFEAGLRFEYVDQRQTNFLDSATSYARHFADFFPSFSLSYNGKNDMRHSLTFRSSTQRPDYSDMTAASRYVNRYVYEEGESHLKPTRVYALEYTWMWKFIMAQVGYKYIHNALGTIVESQEDNPTVIYFKQHNYTAAHQLNLMLNAQRRFGFYEPSLTLMLVEIRLKQYDIDGRRMPYHVTGIVNLNNTFHLPWDILATAEYNCQSNAYIGGIKQKYKNVFNLSLSRSFLRKTLSVTLQAKDLTNNETPKLRYVNRNVSITQSADNDRRSLVLKVSWRFNQSKHKYGGENAAEGEMSRIKK